MLFDSHAHYDDEKFDENEGERDKLLSSLSDMDVCGVINAGTNLDTCKASVALAEKYGYIYAAVGIHPSDCYKYSDIDSVLAEVEKMLEHPKVVALGEIGLDYHYDFSPKDIQMIWFKAQLALSEKTKMPVIIHDRDAHGDVIDTLLKYNVTAVMHSCSESAEDVKRLSKAGHYFSFSGSLTFKNAAKLPLAAAAVPLDRLLIETDCPYLAPVPVRGTKNHSGNLKYIAEKLAEIHGISYKEICDITKQNTEKLFGVLA